MENPAPAFILVADGTVDQIVSGWNAPAHAQQERRDLRNMGCDVRLIETHVDHADTLAGLIDMHLRDTGALGRKALARMAETLGCTARMS